MYSVQNLSIRYIILNRMGYFSSFIILTSLEWWILCTKPGLIGVTHIIEVMSKNPVSSLHSGDSNANCRIERHAFDYCPAVYIRSSSRLEVVAFSGLIT